MYCMFLAGVFFAFTFSQFPTIVTPELATNLLSTEPLLPHQKLDVFSHPLLSGFQPFVCLFVGCLVGWLLVVIYICAISEIEFYPRIFQSRLPAAT